MNELKKLTDDLEYMFLKKIVTGLHHEKINITDSRMYAQEFLKIEPFQSIEDAMQKIHIFTSRHEYFHELDKFMNEYYEEKRMGDIIEKMSKYIKNDQVDEALKIATTS